MTTYPKLWASLKDIGELFNMGEKKIKELASKGFIRTDFSSNAANAKISYCVADLDSYRKRMSAGKKPLVMKGRIQ